MRFSSRLLLLVALGVLGGGLLAAESAGAARPQSVRCNGTADWCGATVSIAGGARNRVVTVRLTDTDLRLVRVSASPRSSGYRITKNGFRLGGSEYRFTLNAPRTNPRGARIVLLFTAGSRGRGIPGVRGHTETANVIFSVGAGKAVSITGGGDGTSVCTRDETVTSFTTQGNDESHSFGFFAKDDGSCYFHLSFSQFRVTVKDSSGHLLGSGSLFLGQRYVFGDYVTSCNYQPWVGATCTSTGKGGEDKADLKITL